MNYLELLQKAREKRTALTEQIRTATTNVQLDTLELDLRKIDIEIRNLEEKVRQQEEQNKGQIEDPAARNFNQQSETLNPLGTYGGTSTQSATTTRNNETDVFGTLEYRTAFRNYVVNGTPIPQEFTNSSMEQRSDEITLVGDVTAVIPTTIMNKVIEDLTVEGKILKRITQTQFQGGVKIPISNIVPTANWLDNEQPSDEQKAEMKASVTFNYHVLEAKISVGLLSATVTLDIFEKTIVRQLKKAMIRAIETAVINGTGSGQPKGILNIELPTKQKISFTQEQIKTVTGWANAEAAVPEAYEDSVVYLMNKTTWEKYLNGMTDSTGQRIGLGKINEKGQKVLNGRLVMTTDKIPGYDSVAVGKTFAVLVNLEDYCLNSNLAMYYKKYYNEDKNKWVHKALMIADGKYACGEVDGKMVGVKGILYLQKGE